MDKIALYFWEPSVSPHKLCLFSSLARHATVSQVSCVAQQGLPEFRRQQGWQVSEAEIQSVSLILAPDRRRINELVAASPADSVHIFSGMRNVPCITEGITSVIKQGRRFGLLHEPRVSEGISGVARFFHSWMSEGSLRTHIDFVLAIGRNGPRWFRATGYRGATIFPFAYFLPSMAGKITFSERNKEAPVRITWLGRLTKEKGIHAFLKAVRMVRCDVTVSIAGVGPELSAVLDLVENTPIAARYCGVLPMMAVPELLAESDILVLPSTTTDEGWGAVVSEALLAGVAVIASRKVGASICLEDNERGYIVTPNSPKAIALAIDKLALEGKLTSSFRALRAKWAEERLTGQAGAAYLMNIVSHIYDKADRPPPFYAD